jgi:hypothetical protein
MANKYVEILNQAKKYVSSFIQGKAIEDIETYKQIDNNEKRPKHIRGVKTEMVKTTIKTMLPDILESIIDRNSAIVRFPKNIPLSNTDKQEIKDRIKDYLERYMFNSEEYVIANYKALKSALILNYGVVKIWLETKIQKDRQVIVDTNIEDPDIIDENGIGYKETINIIPIKPRFKFVDVADFFYIPDADTIFNSSFIAHRTRMFKGKVKALAEAGIYDITGLDLEKLGVSYDSPWDAYTKSNYKNYIQNADDNMDENSKKVEVYECYVKEADQDGNTIYKIITIIGDKVVKIEDNPYNKPPFAIYQYDFDVADVEQESISAELRNLQRTQTNFLRLLFDNAYKLNQAKMRIDPVEYSAGNVRLHELNSDKPYFFATKDAIDQNTLSPKQLPTDLYNITEYIDRMGEKRTGMTTYQQGIPLTSSRETATGVATLLSQSQKRLKLIIRLIMETGFNRMLEVLTKMLEMLDIIPEGYGIYLDSENGLGYKDSVLELQKLDRLTPLMLQLAQMGLIKPNQLLVYVKYLFKAYEIPMEEVFSQQDMSVPMPNGQAGQMVQEAQQGQFNPNSIINSILAGGNNNEGQ